MMRILAWRPDRVEFRQVPALGDVRRDTPLSPFAPAKGRSFAGAKDDNRFRLRGEAAGWLSCSLRQLRAGSISRDVAAWLSRQMASWTLRELGAVSVRSRPCRQRAKADSPH